MNVKKCLELFLPNLTALRREDNGTTETLRTLRFNENFSMTLHVSDG